MADKKPKEYFIVNPAGAVHSVTRQHAEWRLSQGWRMAKDAEIAAYKKATEQRFDRPIAPPAAAVQAAALGEDEAEG